MLAPMFWVFDKAGQRLKYEISRRQGADGFVIVKTRDDGRKEIEEIDHPTVLIERSVSQMRQLEEDGWKAS